MVGSAAEKEEEGHMMAVTQETEGRGQMAEMSCNDPPGQNRT